MSPTIDPSAKPLLKKKQVGTFILKLMLIFTISFFIFFWLTNSSFKENKLLQQTSRVTANFIKIWEEKIPPSLLNILYPDLKPSSQEELLNYKLTMVSKSIDQYFKNLLFKTQEQVANKSLLSFIQNSKNYYNYYKTKRDLQKHLEQNRDILEFSLYDLQGRRIVSLKHKNIPDYYISEELFSRVSTKNNLLLKHKNSANLVLLSSVTHNAKQVMVISQTIHPVFFTRILTYLEASKELFYLKDSDDFIIVDNYDARNLHQEKARIIDNLENGNRQFIGLYETFVSLHEKNIKIDMDSIEYSLGMVIERNNIWGNIFSIFTLVLIFFSSKIAVDAIFSLLRSLFRWAQALSPKNKTPLPTSTQNARLPHNKANNNNNSPIDHYPKKTSPPTHPPQTGPHMTDRASSSSPARPVRQRPILSAQPNPNTTHTNRSSFL